MRKICLLLVVVLAMILLAGCSHDPDATYKVTYYGGADTTGFPPTDDNQYKSGDEATVLGPGILKKEGYTFQNWNTNRDGSGDPYSEGDKITIKGAVFLYAVWIKQ